MSRIETFSELRTKDFVEKLWNLFELASTFYAIIDI